MQVLKLKTEQTVNKLDTAEEKINEIKDRYEEQPRMKCKDVRRWDI